jgi:hypothetical protein
MLKIGILFIIQSLFFSVIEYDPCFVGLLLKLVFSSGQWLIRFLSCDTRGHTYAINIQKPERSISIHCVIATKN